MAKSATGSSTKARTGNASSPAGRGSAARIRTAPAPDRKAATPSPVMLGSARAILRGELDKVGLCTLLTILEMERRTGILVLQRRRQLGRLHVRDGQIIRARIEGQGRQTGVEAVYRMLAWQGDKEAGQFELWQAEVEGVDEIRARTAYLLMEGMRRMDEGEVEVDADPDPDPAANADFQVAF